MERSIRKKISNNLDKFRSNKKNIKKNRKLTYKKSVRRSRGGIKKSVRRSRGGIKKSLRRSRGGIKKSLRRSRGGIKKSLRRSRGGNKKSLTKSRLKYKRKLKDGVLTELIEGTEPVEEEGEIYYTAPTYDPEVIIVPFESQVQNHPQLSKFFTMKKNKVPLQAIKNKMLAEKINPDIIDLDNDNPLTLPLEPVIVEKPKLKTEKKTFFLDNIKDTEFWKKSEKGLINTVEFKSKFIDKNTENIKNIITKKDEKIESKIQPILTSMDPKVRQSSEIVYKTIMSSLPKNQSLYEELSGVSLDDKKHNYIVNILSKDPSTMSTNEINLIYNISNFLPKTKEELQSYNSEFSKNKKLFDEDKVLNFEKLLNILSKVENIYEIIEVYKFKIEGTITLSDVNTKLQLVIDLLNIYKENQLFHRLLHLLKEFVVLGGHKGGFSLIVLPNLITFKSQDKKSTLLNYLVETMISKSYIYSSRDLEDLMKTKLILNLNISDLEKIVIKAEKFNSDVVQRVNKEIYESMKIQIDQSLLLIKKLNDTFRELLDFYGEDNTKEPKISIETYIKNLNEFITKYSDEYKKQEAKAKRINKKILKVTT